MHITDWDTAAHHALCDLFATAHPETDPLAVLVDTMDRFISETFDGTRTDTTIDQRWRQIGAAALAIAAGRNQHLHPDSCYQLLARKHRDYGPRNIWRFTKPGQPGGLLVRVHDKIARLQNLCAATGTPNFESIDDTIVDIVGYAAIGLLVEHGQFLLPVAEDVTV